MSQYQLWIDQQAHPDSTHLNVGGMGFINGRLDIPLFRKAMKILVDNNEALRLLPLIDGRQKLIDDWNEELLEFEDFSADKDPTQATIQWWKKSFLKPFLLDGKSRPWRIGLLRVHEKRYAITFRYHHMFMDGYGVALVLQKLGVIYKKVYNNISYQEEQERDYLQFIADSTHYSESNAIKKDADYWRSIFPKLPPPLLKKCHGAKDSVDTLPLANHYRYLIAQEKYTQLQLFANQYQATSYHLFLAALSIFFYKTYHKNDILIGVPVLNRGGKRYKSTLGMFALIMPLRVTIDASTSVVSLLKSITSTLKRSYRHSKYPLHLLGRDLGMMENGQDRLFDLMLSFESDNFTADFGEAPTSEPQQFFNTVARYPLLVSICEFHDHEPVEVVLESSSLYFSSPETEQLGKRIQHLVMQLIVDPSTIIEQLSILLPGERESLISGNSIATIYHEQPQTFISAFEQQVDINPKAIAIRSKISDIDYVSVNKQANRLAHQLLIEGVKKDDIVAVVMPRQAETIIAFLAIAKSGAAFVPIEPDLPETRLQQLIQQSGTKIALIGEKSSIVKQIENLRSITIDSKTSPQYNPALKETNLATTPAGDDLAYLLFTSGSTGKPKGVLMEHAPLSRRLAWLARTFDSSPNDIALQSIQLSFDPAIVEIMLQLTQGGSIALPPAGPIAPTDIAAYAEAFQATMIIFVPTTLLYFNQTAKNHPKLKLRIAISGGEVLRRQTARDFIEQTGAKLFNLYGPTEACVFATAYEYDRHSNTDPLPIGEPVDDSRIYILDEKLQLLPDGSLGEIYIGGNTLARSYLDNDLLTQQKFIANPFVMGERIYQSGDSGYRDDKGQICYVGRVDNQIKLRGQRIEPAEIEVALCDLDNISAAAVKIVANELHAWVVLNEPENDALCQSLRSALRQKLPDYMVPYRYTAIKALPRQYSGKVDYHALKTSNELSTDDAIISPRTDLEGVLLSLWQDILKTKKIGVECNFFSLGGDSLSALILLSAIDNQFSRKLPLSTLLQNPTVSLLATVLIKHQHTHKVTLSEQKHKQATPIFLAASGHGDALRFMPLATELGDSFTLHMLQPSMLGSFANYQTIEQLANFYATEIEQYNSQYAPIIAGFSIAGITALETARKLEERGIRINQLILIDTVYPNWTPARILLWRTGRWLVKVMRLKHLQIGKRTLGSLFYDPGLNGQILALKNYKPKNYKPKYTVLPVMLVISSGFHGWYYFLFRPWKKIFNSALKEKKINGFHGNIFTKKNVVKLVKLFNSSSMNSL